jgi:hypothetical protein
MKHKTLYKKLHSFAPKLVGEKTQGQIMYWVRKMLSPHNVKVNKIIDSTNTCYSALTVGGFYDPSLDFGDKDIEMYLMFRKDDTKVNLDILYVQILINELFTTLVHEKRHRYQFKKRGFNFGPVYRLKSKIDNEDLLKEIEYYGDPDEVDAYAQEAAIELRLHTESTTKAKYKELFDNYDKKVYNNFLKKFYKYDNKITL